MRILSKINKIVSKPFGVVKYRAQQEIRLYLMQKFSVWDSIQRRIDHFWTKDRVGNLIGHYKPLIIAPDFKEAIKFAAQGDLISVNSIKESARHIMNYEFTVLGARVPSTGFVWNEDWRYRHKWPHQYFKLYNFYEDHKEVPYDVKYPWEASRMNHLVPVMISATLDGQNDYKKWVSDVLEDWKEKNPLAHSINWHPMECSMRMINLIVLLELLLVSGNYDTYDIELLLKLLCAHGEFVYHTIEYTDVRGNHFTANIVALLLAGLVLEGIYKPSPKWLDYAKKHIQQEALHQYTKDGVNFEKSTPYHRLVTELFLIAMIALKRRDDQMSETFINRIKKACEYTKAYTRPDGKSPIVGDNDSAQAFNFEINKGNDHSALLFIASILFHSSDFVPIDLEMNIAVPLLFGMHGVEKWDERIREVRNKEQSLHFENGGVVVIKDDSNYLWIDVGEVGMHNRGGHGHNDLFSFELMMNRHLIIMDPGCPVYTGDPKIRNLFRSTSYHNTLMVDQEEIAPFKGMWSYENSPVPVVEVNLEHETKIVRGFHSGYCRLNDPVSLSRSFEFHLKKKELICKDQILCKQNHHITRSLHLGPELTVKVMENTIEIYKESMIAQIIVDQKSKILIEDGWHSPGYGIQKQNKIIRFISLIEGETELWFKLIATK